MDIRNAWRAAALLAAVAVVGAGCGTDTTGGMDTFAPIWITASWSGGAAGAPNDRTDREPEDFFGSLCPANSVDLYNHSGGFAGLNIVNRCTIMVTYYICATKGAGPQPNLGLQECAQDPFDTPLGQFKVIPLFPGSEGDYVNATPDLSVQVFYCSDESQMFTAPLRCAG